MYYSAIGVIALMVLLISNPDILLNRNRAFEIQSWKVYRGFLISVIVYYITDILWGILESKKMVTALFIDTSVYFIAMAVGVLFWTNYVVTYLDENEKPAGKFFVYAGLVISSAVTFLAVINVFIPVLFTVDENCVYTALPSRYVILASQILVLILISINAFRVVIKKTYKEGTRQRYNTVAYFGIIMTVFLLLQTWFPLLPMYSIGYMLGTCLIRSFVIGEEKEEYRSMVEEAKKVADLRKSMTALLDNMPAVTFSKDAETGVYLACNQAFAEYAHKENPEGVIGLTDAQIFDPETASHFEQDDRMALSMNEPYIFFEDVKDAEGNDRQFQTTKLKFIDAMGRLCTLGMGQDVTDMVRIQRENATTKEAYEKARSSGIIFTHIAQTLARGYEDLFYVNLESEEYIEYHTNERTGELSEIRRGFKFFDSCRKEANIYVYAEDREKFVNAMTRENLLNALENGRNFIMAYRLIHGEGSTYVSMKVSQMEDDDRFIIIGVTNIDEEMKQRREAERVREEHIAYARINALAGDYLCVYVVDPETGRYREFSSTEGFKSFSMPGEGDDFFTACRDAGRNFVFSGDLGRFLATFKKESVLAEIERRGIFALSYRILVNGETKYVKLKASMVEEKEGRRLIIGINDIDNHVRQEKEYAKRLATAQSRANIDALTGVKTKHAYLDEEEKLDRQIAENIVPDFAIVIMDLNDLKKVNDTEGHQAGDTYIKNACKFICDTFKRSPVYRVGGDEFAVVVRGEDYEHIDGLIKTVADHNTEEQSHNGMVIACGMSRFDGDSCVAEVFERADQNMYDNKGRLKGERS